MSWKQKGFLLLGAAVTAVAILVFVRLIGKPEFKPLYTNMQPSDAQALGAKLAEKNIQYEISADGKTVNVTADKLDQARLELASGEMPRSGRLGFELFDKMNWGETEFDEKVNYQRALEGELERTIQTLKNVESARVHLVMPTESLFLDREHEAKASVIVNLRGGRLSPDVQLSVAKLVSGAVNRLAPENVTVIDANSNHPIGSFGQDSLSPATGLGKELAARMVATLEPTIGPDRVRASVNVEYDTSSSEENQETFDPKSQVSVSSQKSDEQIGGMVTGGVPGTSSNVPGASASGAKVTAQSGDGSQTSHTEATSYAVSKVVRHTMQPAGRLRRVTAALVVDDALEAKSANGKKSESRRKRTPEELKQIEELAKASIGFDAARGDTISVQNLSFIEPEVEVPTKPTMVEKVRVTLTDWSSVVRYGALLLLFLLCYMLLLRPIKAGVMKALKEAPARQIKAKAANEAIQEISRRELGEGQPTLQQALVLKKQMVDRLKSEPVATSRVVQSWVRQGE